MKLFAGRGFAELRGERLRAGNDSGNVRILVGIRIGPVSLVHALLRAFFGLLSVLVQTRFFLASLFDAWSGFQSRCFPLGAGLAGLEWGDGLPHQEGECHRCFPALCSMGIPSAECSSAGCRAHVGGIPIGQSQRSSTLAGPNMLAHAGKPPRCRSRWEISHFRHSISASPCESGLAEIAFACDFCLARIVLALVGRQWGLGDNGTFLNSRSLLLTKRAVFRCPVVPGVKWALRRSLVWGEGGLLRSLPTVIVSVER